MTKKLPDGYIVQYKKLAWNEPAMHHVYLCDRQYLPVASRESEAAAIAAAHAHMQANQPKPEAPIQKKATANKKKKPKMELDEKSGLHFPASGVEPIVEFHNTSQKNGFTVEAANPSGSHIDFGGIFSGPKAGMSGEYTHAVILDPDHHMTHGDLHKESWSKIDAAIKKIRLGLSKQEREELFDYLAEDKEAGDLWDSDEDLARKFFGGSDAGEAGWSAQAMRGKLAFALGYKSVDMKDETGTSTLVAPGHVTHPLKDGESFNNASARIQDAWQDWKSRSNNK